MPHFKVTYRDPAHPKRTVTLLTAGTDINAAVWRAICIEPRLTLVRVVKFDRETGQETIT